MSTLPSSHPEYVWPVRFLMKQPHKEEKGCVCSCMHNDSEHRSSAYIQPLNSATNVEIFLRNGCHFPMLKRKSLFLINLPFHCVESNTGAAHLLQYKFNRSISCMHIPLFDKSRDTTMNVYFPMLFSDANFLRQ